MQEQTVLQKESDSLSLIRSIAAIEVMFYHALVHLNILEANTVILLIKWILVNMFAGVPLFYTISGFGIWQSINNSKSFSQYIKKRFWRIYPELWLAVLIELVVLLLLYSHPIDWVKLVLFAIAQGTVVQFYTPDFLRGYGCGCPNGSLWTIGIFIQFYLVSYFTHKVLHGRKIKTWLCTLAILLLLAWFSTEFVDNTNNVFYKLYKNTFIPYFWMFVLGAFVAEYKERILPFCKKFWFLLLSIALVFAIINFDIRAHYRVFNTVLLFTGWLGFSYVFPKLRLKTEPSYGIYLYHMTVVNAMIVLGFIGKPLYLAVVLLFSFVLSYISAKTVGNWSINRKKMLK